MRPPTTTAPSTPFFIQSSTCVVGTTGLNNKHLSLNKNPHTLLVSQAPSFAPEWHVPLVSSMRASRAHGKHHLVP